MPFAFFPIVFGMGQLLGWTCCMVYFRSLFCNGVLLNQVLRVVAPTALDSSLCHHAHLRLKARHRHLLLRQYAPLAPDPSYPNTTCKRSAVIDGSKVSLDGPEFFFIDQMKESCFKLSHHERYPMRPQCLDSTESSFSSWKTGGPPTACWGESEPCRRVQEIEERQSHLTWSFRVARNRLMVLWCQTINRSVGDKLLFLACEQWQIQMKRSLLLTLEMLCWWLGF